MKTKTLSMSTLLGFLGVVTVLHVFSSYAHASTIKCETAFGEKSFTIDDQQISFSKEDELGISRSISSIASESVRTHKKNSGFTKSLYIGGNKHRINIQNTNEFSDVNDYLSITSPKGHEMTYPLTCLSV